MCDRAVGERCTTENIGSIHMLHHWYIQWSGDVYPVHEIHRNAINKTKSSIYFFPPLPLWDILSFSIHPPQYLDYCSMEKNTVNSHTHMHACVHANTNIDTKTIMHNHSHCSIQYQLTVTTSAFHFPFKIMRSSSLLS